MKKTITTLCLAALSIPAFCQITLSQSNYPAPPATVPLQDISALVTSVPAIGTSQVWDYSTLTAGTATSNSFVAVSGNSNFPTAQFYRTMTKGLTSALGFYYDEYYAITASGAEAIGIHITPQSYGLGAMTGNNTDTLYVLDKYITFAPNARPLVAFPATIGSTWQSNLRVIADMQLTVSAYSLNKTPMQEVFYYQRLDTIVGWGTLKLPAQTGFNSNIPVLQDKLYQQCKDSFYLGGSPANSTVTNAFGITQGQVTGPSYIRLAFYRAGEFNYQMMLNMTDNTFSAVSSAFVNNNLPVATGINDIAQDGFATAYPNPMSGRTFDIRTEVSAQVAAVSITDLSGREIEHISIANTSGIVHIETTATLADGLYIYSLIDAKGNMIAKGKILSVK